MSLILDGSLGITTPAETVQGALTTTGNTILGDASTDTLNVGNGGLVKDASGNVGIGTASPVGKLQLSQTNNTTINGGAYLNLGKSENGVGGYHLIGMGYNATSNYAPAYMGYVETTNNAGTAGDLVYFTRPSGSADTVSPTEQMRIDSAGLLKFNSGYGSVATAYGCRAWVNFNGTGTVAIRSSGNVSSITDGGVGTYTVNFTTAMVDVNYCFVSGRCGSGSGGTSPAVTNGSTSQLVGSVAIISIQGNNTISDQEYLTLGIFR